MGAIGAIMNDAKSDIQEIIAKIRQRIPSVNLQSFDASAGSMVEELAVNPERFGELTEWFWSRAKFLMENDVGTVPPELVWQDNETATEYLDRCYQAVKPKMIGKAREWQQ